MKYGLMIPPGVLEVYRIRVVSDLDRHSRPDRQIGEIVLDAFRNSILPKRVPDNYHLLVSFRDPLTNEDFPPSFHLVLRHDRNGTGQLVAKTIEYFNGRRV